MNAPNKSGNNRTIMIIFGILALLAVGSCCFGGLVFGGAWTALSNAERTYYPECEMTAGDACKLCCNQQGHSGYASGAMMNDDGRVCGCL